MGSIISYFFPPNPPIEFIEYIEVGEDPDDKQIKYVDIDDYINRFKEIR